MPAKNTKTLQQLILLQDWQKVLIRARLFPAELSQPTVLRLSKKLCVKTLPLHLACALNPPQAVVQLFLELNPIASKAQLQPARAHHSRWRVKIQRTDSSIEEAKTSLLPKSTNDSSSSEPALQNTSDTHSDSSTSNESTSSHHKTILQLSLSGGLVPMSLSKTVNPTPYSQQNLISTSKEPCAFYIHWDLEPLVKMVASKPSLLPLHIACLFEASHAVIQLLLDAHPVAAMSDVLGMLPIHWVASGWIVPPLVPPPGGLATRLAESTIHGPLETLRVLTKRMPELIRAKSGSHDMTPAEYVRDCMQDGEYKDACLWELNDYDDDEGSVVSSIVFVDSSTSSDGSCIPYSYTCLRSLMTLRNWPAVLQSLHDDPHCASTWLYGIDENSKKPRVWKRLPIHLALLLGAPLEIIQELIRVYPSSIAMADPSSGCLPLHMACCCNDASVDQCGIATHVLNTFPNATKAVDNHGRLPLHMAVCSKASFPVIAALVQHDPQAACIPDVTGKTPMQYAVQVFGQYHVATELLAMVVVYEQQQQEKEQYSDGKLLQSAW
jgi:hypothetical protein